MTRAEQQRLEDQAVAVLLQMPEEARVRAALRTIKHTATPMKHDLRVMIRVPHPHAPAPAPPPSAKRRSADRGKRPGGDPLGLR